MNQQIQAYINGASLAFQQAGFSKQASDEAALEMLNQRKHDVLVGAGVGGLGASSALGAQILNIAASVAKETGIPIRSILSQTPYKALDIGIAGLVGAGLGAGLGAGIGALRTSNQHKSSAIGAGSVPTKL